LIPNLAHMDLQVEPVNCVPLLVVTTCGMPYLEIHIEMKESTTSCAEIPERGWASGYLVDRSTMVRKYLLPVLEVGRGLMMSTCMWEKRRSGTGIASGGPCSRYPGLPSAQCWHSFTEWLCQRPGRATQRCGDHSPWGSYASVGQRVDFQENSSVHVLWDKRFEGVVHSQAGEGVAVHCDLTHIRAAGGTCCLFAHILATS